MHWSCCKLLPSTDLILILEVHIISITKLSELLYSTWCHVMQLLIVAPCSLSLWVANFLKTAKKLIPVLAPHDNYKLHGIVTQIIMLNYMYIQMYLYCLITRMMVQTYCTCTCIYIHDGMIQESSLPLHRSQW